MADDDLYSIANEANDVVRVERITHHIQRIREDQHAMRAAIEHMSEAVTRLALVEERQARYRWCHCTTSAVSLCYVVGAQSGGGCRNNDR